jgi:dethiobiotin synthetase
VTAALFVTGTDTGVGKTTVSAGILAALRARGHRVAALKPGETGCADLDAPADLTLLRDAGGDAAGPCRWRTPVAPAVAARREGVPFSLDAVFAARAELLARDPALLLVEGAGGLLVPYDDDMLGAHLARALGHPLLVVARASLGTINHTLLTISEARRHDLRVAGVILSRVVAERGPDEDDNAAEITRRARVPVLGTVRHLAPAARRDPAALAAAISDAFDPARLLAI